MSKSIKDILKMIEENDIKMVDFKMVDINGVYRHVTIPAGNFSEDTETGCHFSDGDQPHDQETNGRFGRCI